MKSRKLPFEIGEVQSFTLKEGSLRSVISIPQYCFDIDGGGYRIVSGSTDGKVRVGGLHDGKLIKTLSGHYDDVNCINLLNDRVLVTGCDAAKVIFWNLPEFSVNRKISFRDGIKSSILCFHSLNEKKLIIGDITGNVYLYDYPSGNLKICGNVNQSIYCFCMNTVGNLLISAGGVTDHPFSVNLWNVIGHDENELDVTESCYSIPHERVEKRVSSLCSYREDEQRELLITASLDGSIHIFDISAKPFLIKEICVEGFVSLNNMILFPNYGYVMIGGFKSIYFVNLKFLNLKNMVEFEIHEGDVNELVWVEESKTFLSYCLQSGKILVHDVLPDFRIIDLEERVGFLNNKDSWMNFSVKLYDSRKIESYKVFVFCG